MREVVGRDCKEGLRVLVVGGKGVGKIMFVRILMVYVMRRGE